MREPARHLAYCWSVAGGASWRRSHMVSAAVARGRLGSEEMREAKYGGEDNHKERGIVSFAGAKYALNTE